MVVASFMRNRRLAVGICDGLIAMTVNSIKTDGTLDMDVEDA